MSGLKLARQPYYRWLAQPITDREPPIEYETIMAHTGLPSRQTQPVTKTCSSTDIDTFLRTFGSRQRPAS